MKIIFCDSVVDNKLAEPDYLTEFDAAIKNGFDTEIFSFEAIEDGNITKALKLIRISEEKEFAIYSG